MNCHVPSSPATPQHQSSQLLCPSLSRPMTFFVRDVDARPSKRQFKGIRQLMFPQTERSDISDKRNLDRDDRERSPCDYLNKRRQTGPPKGVRLDPVTPSFFTPPPPPPSPPGSRSSITLRVVHLPPYRAPRAPRVPRVVPLAKRGWTNPARQPSPPKPAKAHRTPRPTETDQTVELAVFQVQSHQSNIQTMAQVAISPSPVSECSSIENRAQ